MAGVESIVSFEQVQLLLQATSNAVQSLDRIQIWWHGLSMVEQRKQRNKSYLVTETEEVCDVEATVFGSALLTKAPPVEDDEEEKDQKDKNKSEQKEKKTA